MKKAEVCIVETQVQAEAVVRRLYEIGFAPQDVSVLFPSQQGERELTYVRSTKAPEGAVAGGWAGGLLGAAFGVLAGVGLVMVPGFGVLLSAGPVLAALSGAAALASIGSVVGALVGSSFPEYEAKLYEGKNRGRRGLLLAVHTESPSERRRAAAVFRQMGGRDIGAVIEAPLAGG